MGELFLVIWFVISPTGGVEFVNPTEQHKLCRTLTCVNNLVTSLKTNNYRVDINIYLAKKLDYKVKWEDKTTTTTDRVATVEIK